MSDRAYSDRSQSLTPRGSDSVYTSSLPISPRISLPFDASCSRLSETQDYPTSPLSSHITSSSRFISSDEDLTGVLFAFDSDDEEMSGDEYSTEADLLDSASGSASEVSLLGMPTPREPVGEPAKSEPDSSRRGEGGVNGNGEQDVYPSKTCAIEPPRSSKPSLSPPRTPSPTPQAASVFDTSHSRASTLPSPDQGTPSSPLQAIPGTIDYVTFPTVFDTILQHCDSRGLLSMRGASKTVQAIVDSWQYRQIEVFPTEDNLSLNVYSSGLQPRLRSTLSRLAAFSHTRVVSLYGPLPPDAFAHLANYLSGVETVRLVPNARGQCVDKCPIRTDNLVIVSEPRMPKTDPGADSVVMTSRLKRVVIHLDGFADTNGMWYHQVLYPYGTCEVTLVFTDWRQPFTPRRAARGRARHHRESHLASARFQQLCNAIEHILTKQETRHGYTRCVIVDIEAIDSDWLGLTPFIPIARVVRNDVYESLSRWRTEEQVDEAIAHLQFMTASQWQASF